MLFLWKFFGLRRLLAFFVLRRVWRLLAARRI
jgi:hypothetical protein